LAIGFIEQLQVITIANSHTLQFTRACTKCSQSAMSSQVVVWYRLPTMDVPLPLFSRTIPVPQLPASHSNSSHGLNCSSSLTAHQPTHFTPLYSTALHSLTELSKSESELLYDWLFTANQFILETSLLRLTTNFFFSNSELAVIVLM
jgi:hypothetical protein